MPAFSLHDFCSAPSAVPGLEIGLMRNTTPFPRDTNITVADVMEISNYGYQRASGDIWAHRRVTNGVAVAQTNLLRFCSVFLNDTVLITGAFLVWTGGTVDQLVSWSFFREPVTLTMQTPSIGVTAVFSSFRVVYQ